MYLHEILSDVRAWLALSIFCTGAAFGLAISLSAQTLRAQSYTAKRWRARCVILERSGLF